MVTVRSLVSSTGAKIKSLTSRVFGKSQDEGQEEHKSEHKLPYRQLGILGEILADHTLATFQRLTERDLAISRFAEPITLTSIFPYLPEMIESFHVDETNIAFWAGLTSAIFSLSQCLTAVPWGRASDHWGRKPVILLGLTCTMVTSLMWGFSTSLPIAVVARALQGGMNGNVGIIRTMVAEMCPWRELQPRAFSIMPLVWNLGSVLGPAFGGALSNPYHRGPKDDGSADGRLLWKFPYALPNILGSCFFLVGIITGILFLDETLASRKHQRDYGRRLGIELEIAIQRQIKAVKDSFRRLRGEETEPLLSSRNPEYFIPEDTNTTITAVDSKPGDLPSKSKSPSYTEVLTPQTILNLLVYTILAMHSIAFDQLLPVFMHHPRSGHDILPLPSLGDNILRFNAGFGLYSGRIGLLFTAYGIVGIFYQFLIFPPVARKYGVANCLKAVMVIMPVIYILAPFSTLAGTVEAAQGTLFALWLVKGLCSTFAFPCTTILLTNGASSIRVLATVNGIATSVSAIGRAAGPSLSGTLFTWGVKEGYIVAPFWMLAGVGVFGAVASFWLEEGEGFGDDGKDGQVDDDEDEEELLREEQDEDVGPLKHIPSASAAARPTGEATGVMAPLFSREWTRGSVSSAALTESDVDEEERFVGEVSIGSYQSGSDFASRRASGTRPRPLRRKSSAPFGMGPGFRRLSSNLGESRSGYGTGGGLAG